jgi:hypothetical protein
MSMALLPDNANRFDPRRPRAPRTVLKVSGDSDTDW